MLAGLPTETRKPRMRSEILQMRVLARFPPGNLDPRWLLNGGDLFEEWAWSRLAARGDTEALDRMLPAWTRSTSPTRVGLTTSRCSRC